MEPCPFDIDRILIAERRYAAMAEVAKLALANGDPVFPAMLAARDKFDLEMTEIADKPVRLAA
jgi:hypothetical protein